MSKRFSFIETPLAGLYRVERKILEDQRGFFARFYCEDEFKEIGFNKSVVQMNQTLTRNRGAIRGLHFQHPPHSEIKLVTCLRGEILDVAVDIRKGSPTYLKWHAEHLSAKNHASLLIPDGFAHGFQTLTEDCQLLYLHSSFYAPKAEGALNALDPALAINWPLEVTEMSERDKNHSLLSRTKFEGINV